MAKLVSEMTAAECSEYEREVQSATRREMEIGQPGLAYELRGVELWGSSPDTEIVVRYWDPRYGRETVNRYQVWRALVDQRTGIPEPPPSAAVLIKVWALGG